MSSVSEWGMYAGIVFGAAAIGVFAGQLVQWRGRRGLYVPEWAHATKSRRVGAMMLAVLAIMTVFSSMLTSYELNRVETERAENARESRECTQHLVERLANRTQIGEADHLNTTRFVEKLRTALTTEGLSSPAIIRASDRYLEEQRRLEEDRRHTPIDEHACR